MQQLELKRIYYYFFTKIATIDYSLTQEDREELKSHETKLVELEETENNRNRQKLFRDNLKYKIESLDDETRKKKIIGQTGETLEGVPKKNDDKAVIASIIDIALSGSATHGKRRNEIIRSVKTLDQLTVALNNER